MLASLAAPRPRSAYREQAVQYSTTGTVRVHRYPLGGREEEAGGSSVPRHTPRLNRLSIEASPARAGARAADERRRRRRAGGGGRRAGARPPRGAPTATRRRQRDSDSDSILRLQLVRKVNDKHAACWRPRACRARGPRRGRRPRPHHVAARAQQRELGERRRLRCGPSLLLVQPANRDSTGSTHAAGPRADLQRPRDVRPR